MRYLTLFALAMALTGCRSTPTSHGPPQDPLLVSKRPVEGKQGNPSTLVASSCEPSLPTVPVTRSKGEDPLLTPAILAQLANP